MAAPLFIALLKTPGTALGITAPLFIWFAAWFILVGTLACLVRLWWLVRREASLLHNIRTQLITIRATSGNSPRDGLNSTMYEAMVQVFEPLAIAAPALVAAWRRFDAQVVVQRDTEGQYRFWTPESAATVFNDSTILEPSLNRSFFSAVPGMATGAGLLCTFLAILIALLDVTLQDEQFRGLDTLISGLSGKFLSSIAALSVATLYIFFEKRLLHRLGQGVHELGVTLDDLVPRLTSAHLMMAIREQMQGQTLALQHFRSDLTTTLQESMQAGIRPLLERMVRPIEELQQWLRTTETQRADATSGRLEMLMQQLSHSLGTTLTGMSERFAQTLSGSATQELTGVAAALSGSAQLLSDMNAQFLATQASFHHLVELARNNTTEQMSMGKAQVEELTVVLRDMMAQMHDTAGLSVNRMAAALTGVVHDLSNKVEEMGDRMSQTVSTNSGKAAEATQVMMGKVDQWSANSTHQLAQLIERHQAHLERVQDVQRTLDTTLAQFKSALSEYATVTSGLKSISAQTTTMVHAASGALKNLKDTGESIEKTAKLAALLGERFAESSRQQEEVQQRLALNLQRYQQIFHEVEGAAASLLEQVEQHLQRYMATTQQGFTHLTQAADEHFARASQRLGDMVNGLDEHLQDLTDIFERLGRSGGSNGRQQ